MQTPGLHRTNVPGPANRFGDRTPLLILLFTGVLASLFVLDITTTQAILVSGGVELNPLMTGVVAYPLIHTILKFGILGLVVPVALTAESRVRGSGIALYAILIVMYALVTLNNITVLVPHIL